MKTKMNYSERLGDIQDKSFQAALDRFGLGDFVSAEAIPYGLFGQNVFLTSTKGEYVFRGNPHGVRQFETERFMAERLHTETSVSVPWPYLVEESDQPFGWPYVIMPRLLGMQLSNPDARATLSEQDLLEIAEAMGVNLAHMHQLQRSRPGLYDAITRTVRPLNVMYVPPWLQTEDYWVGLDELDLSQEEIYQRWIYSKIDLWLKEAIDSSDPTAGRATTPEDVAWVASVLDECGAALLEPFHPCFVMEDYKEGNTVVDKINGRWQVSGVFDLMQGYFGDGEADLSRNFGEYLVAKEEPEERAYRFLNAYVRTRGEQAIRPGFTKRFAMYMLMDKVGLWAYGRKEGWFDGFADFRTYCEPFINLKTERLPIALREIGC